MRKSWVLPFRIYPVTILDLPSVKLAYVDQLLSREEYWTKGAIARADDGEECSAHAGIAVRWSLLGAMTRTRRLSSVGWRNFIAGHPLVLSVDALIREQCQARGFPECIAFNDAPETTFADVKELLRESLEQAKAQEAVYPELTLDLVGAKS